MPNHYVTNPFGSNTTLLKDKKKNTNNTVLTEPTTVVSENSAPHGQPGHVHQSGDDWGMEDPLEGSDEPDFANFTEADWEAYNAQIQAESDEGPTEIPGEVDSSGFSSDFTDSGQQTETDQPLSMAEIIYDQTGPDAAPDADVPGVKGWREKLAGSQGGGYGKKRIGEQSRKQMNLTSGRSSSLLTS